MKSAKLLGTQGQPRAVGSNTAWRKKSKSGNTGSRRRPPVDLNVKIADLETENAELKAERTEQRARYDQLKRAFARYIRQQP